MSDPAIDFLVRKDRKALRKRLTKNEKERIVVQARRDGDLGLLAATTKRVLFVYKRGLRYRLVAWEPKQIAQVSERRAGHGEVHLGTKDGQKLVFQMLQRGAGEAFCETLRPTPPKTTGKSVQARKDGPMMFIPKQRTAEGQPAGVAKPQAKPHPRGTSHDPLSASKTDKLARLERLHEQGLIDKGEYRWQKDALERS